MPTTEAPHGIATAADALRTAYEARDIDRLMALFADDAEITLAPGTFRGKDAIRAVFEWDARLSPQVRITEAGIGTEVVGNSAVMERVLHLEYQGIPYEEHAVTVVEFDESGLITRYRSYYDKLDVLDQISSRLPGLEGRVARTVVRYLLKEGRKGLTVPPAHDR